MFKSKSSFKKSIRDILTRGEDTDPNREKALVSDFSVCWAPWVDQ